MNTWITDEEMLALGILKSCGVSVLELSILAKETLEAGRGRLRRARECVRLGEEQLRLREKTVTFQRAVDEALSARSERRARTVTDFRYYCKRLMRMNSGLGERRVRSITAEESQKYLEKAFGNSPSQYKKGRAIMSGVFSTSIRRGWCDVNPVSRVESPRVVETPIKPLSCEEVVRLEKTARMPEHQDMQLSLHLMLYCGMRPTEVSRINPERDIDWEEGLVLVRPATSKTGGGRVVPLRLSKRVTNRTIPCCWKQRWQALRKAAGWDVKKRHPWVPDTCRHTFASYHAAHYRDFSMLQQEMGHRDSTLLRTRYVMACHTREAALFWADAGKSQ